jgi:hypothetical protein
MTVLPKAEVHPRSCHVAEVPQPDSCTAANLALFDHLVGDGEQSGWNVEA